MQQKYLLPAGVSDFYRLIHHKSPDGLKYLFIDKTLMIKDFINSGEEISLITRPRRFGKTMNLSMLEHFPDFVTLINPPFKTSQKRT
jgi:hypothetical protein